MTLRNLTEFVQMEISFINERTPADDFQRLLYKAWKNSLRRIEFQCKLNTDSYSIAKQRQLELQECLRTYDYVRKHISKKDTNIVLLFLIIDNWRDSLERIYNVMTEIPSLQAAIKRVSKEDQ